MAREEGILLLPARLFLDDSSIPETPPEPTPPEGPRVFTPDLMSPEIAAELAALVERVVGQRS